ncbi:MAG: hypothetical protein ACERKN_00740 [Velocimicrobium sp.]
MINPDILNISLNQSAVDSNCSADDFKSFEYRVVISKKNSNARKYLELPFYCDLSSYRNNIVVAVSGEILEIIEGYINKYIIERFFEPPNLHVPIEKLKPYEMSVCFVAEYFLPNMNVIRRPECQYE